MSSPPRWSSANSVTVARIALVPVFGWALYQSAPDGVVWSLVAAALFVVAALSDQLDGYLARSRDEITPLGKLLDPIADKLLMGTALVLLSVLDRVPWWVTVVILVREVGITVLRFAVLRRGIIPASPGGKLKTVLQSVAIGLWLLPLAHMPGWVTTLAEVLLYVTVVVTVATGLDYLRRALWPTSQAVERVEPAGP